MTADLGLCYTLLQDVTPLRVDCGQVCGGVCCRDTGDDNGMLLFPGEREFLTRHFPASAFHPTANGGWLLVCDGRCDRRYRPLSCRIFPLFPLLEQEGRVRCVIDPRAWRVCPLARVAEEVCFDKAFVRRVRRVGRLLAADDACRRFLQEQTLQLQEWGRLLPGGGLQRPSPRRKAERK